MKCFSNSHYHIMYLFILYIFHLNFFCSLFFGLSQFLHVAPMKRKAIIITQDLGNSHKQPHEKSFIFEKAQSGLELQALFHNIANEILNECVLCVADRMYRINELEFYVKSKDHPDCFSHAHELTLFTKCWYFHSGGKALDRETYRGGTYKGLDFTMGLLDWTEEIDINVGRIKHLSEEERVYAAFLIRSIEQIAIEQQAVELVRVEGPSCIVDHILAVTGCHNISSLIDKNGGYGTSHKTAIIYLTKVISSDRLLMTLLPHRDIMTSSRVGLTLKRWGLAGLPFICKHYRFFTVVPQKGRIHYIIALFEHHYTKTGKLTLEMAQELAIGYLRPARIKVIYLAFLLGIKLWKEHRDTSFLDQKYVLDSCSDSNMATINGYCYAAGYL
jgi:hypothetical protein